MYKYYYIISEVLNIHFTRIEHTSINIRSLMTLNYYHTTMSKFEGH